MAQNSDADMSPAAERMAADTEDIDQSDSDDAHVTHDGSPADTCQCHKRLTQLQMMN